MKLDLNFSILDLGGKAIEGVNAGKLIADQLVGETKGDAFKFYDWGRKLFNLEAIEVDKSDLKKVRDFVENSERITILAKAQILSKIDECKE